jgi:hypothetical protein
MWLSGTRAAQDDFDKQIVAWATGVRERDCTRQLAPLAPP